MAGGSRTLEPEGPAKSDGVCWWGTIQKAQTTHQFHATSHRSPQLVLWEECTANGPRDYRNCKRAELWPRGGPSLVLQPTADAEKHEQDQCLPSSVAKDSGRIGIVCQVGHGNCSTDLDGLLKVFVFFCVFLKDIHRYNGREHISTIWLIANSDFMWMLHLSSEYQVKLHGPFHHTHEIQYSDSYI